MELTDIKQTKTWHRRKESALPLRIKLWGKTVFNCQLTNQASMAKDSCFFSNFSNTETSRLEALNGQP